MMETITLLRTQDPVPVRQLQPLVPVDLSVIVHKCLQREPLQRYVSVDALHEDLQRFLDGRSILARPTPLWRKSWKWARRRPALAASLATAFAATTALLIGWAMFTKEVQVAKNNAEQERDIAKTQTKRAERNAAWAMEAVDKLITQVGDQRLASTPQMDQTRKELLQTAVSFCLKFAEDRDNPDPEARNQVALAYRRLAKIHRALGETKPWLESLEIATGIHRDLVKQYPQNDEYLIEFGKSLNNLSNVKGETSGIEGVVATLEEAIAAKMELVIRHPKSAEYRSSLATSLYSIGSKYRVVKPEKAEEVYQQSNELLKGLVEEYPENLTYRAAAKGLYGNWTAYSLMMGRPAAAIVTAMAMKQLAESDPRGLAHAEVRENLASAFEAVGGALAHEPQSRRESLAAYERQSELIEGLLRDFPDRIATKESFLRCQYNISNILRDLSEFDRAEKGLKMASTFGENWSSINPNSFQLKLFTARLQMTAGQIALERDLLQDAMKHFQLAESFYSPIFDGEGDPEIVCQANHFRACRALTLYCLGDVQEAMDGMLATNTRMKVILEKYSDFREAKRLYTFSSANFVLMKIRSGKPSEALEFANGTFPNFLQGKSWTAQLLAAAAKAAMGSTNEAMTVLRETPGEEIQSDMWPDRFTVVVVGLCHQAIARDPTLSTDERNRLTDEYSIIANRELSKAQENGYFRLPHHRACLFKHAEVSSILSLVEFRLDPL